MKNPFTWIYGVVRQWHDLRNLPVTFEFAVTEHCNLNCKGCSHYSPLASPSTMPSLEALEADAARLAAVCAAATESVTLIGGETLLYPHLPEAMRILSHHFPGSRRYIFTNGLLLPKMPDEFWQAARECGFALKVTRYPVKFDYDAAEALCRAHGVEAIMLDHCSSSGRFFRFALDPTKSQPPRMTHFKCYQRGCLTVTGGRLYQCATSAFAHLLRKVSPHRFEVTPDDYIDLDNLKSLRQVRRILTRPVPFCRSCINPPQRVPYGPSRREASEWIVDNGGE